jgi:hypothetical protein
MPEINGSRILLYQLFYNLINNPLKVSKPDSSSFIQITTKTLDAAEAERWVHYGMKNIFVGQLNWFCTRPGGKIRLIYPPESFEYFTDANMLVCFFFKKM